MLTKILVVSGIIGFVLIFMYIEHLTDKIPKDDH